MIYAYFRISMRISIWLTESAFKVFILNSHLKCFFNVKRNDQVLQCTWHKTIKTFDEMPVIIDPDKFWEAYKNEIKIEGTQQNLKEKMEKSNKKAKEMIEKIINQEQQEQEQAAENILCLGKRKGSCDNNEISKKQKQKQKEN